MPVAFKRVSRRRERVAFELSSACLIDLLMSFGALGGRAGPFRPVSAYFRFGNVPGLAALRATYSRP